MILAAVSSGRSLLVTFAADELALAGIGGAPAFSTVAEPPVAAAASKPVVRTVITFTLSALCTVAMALPA